MGSSIPAAGTVFENRNALVNFVNLHAECIEFIFEFHDKLLKELEILILVSQVTE